MADGTPPPPLPRSNTISSNGRVHKPLASTNGASASAPGTNPRSCVTCRRRKVKCDKKQPCSNCTRAKIECNFPAPGRAPRKARKPPDSELLERLRRLEGVVQTLGAQVDDEPNSPERDGRATSPQSGSESKTKVESADGPGPGNCPFGQHKAPEEGSPENKLESRFGRLVINEGKSRYLSQSYWASLNNEVEDLKGFLNESSSDEEDYSTPSTQTSSNHHGFMFGYSSVNVDMLALHPPPEQIPKYWQLFKENVDPLVKLLHIPTIEPKILEAKDHLDHLPKGLEALMFSIYYGAITSLQKHETKQIFGLDQETLLARYRFGVEQALARARFLDTEEIIVLQAFVLFLVLLRKNDDARILWTLTGLVVRLAQSLGCHRDGSHFDMSPFECEMRRRLWWHVCILDSRSSEDHGSDPTIVEAQFDTKMPLNCDDRDLSTDMKELPENRTGFTEMTFCLIRYEIANTMRRIMYVPPGPVKCNQFFASLTTEEKEKWISDCHQRLEERYLKDCDMTVPLYWVAATISRLVMSKMWLIVYHPHQRKDGGASLPPEIRDKLFLTSLENVEYSILLETDEHVLKWSWLFKSYVQWHAIAFILSELCIRTRGECVDRAWRAIEMTIKGRGDNLDSKRGTLWKPLRRLMYKAREARRRALLKDQQAAAAAAAAFAVQQQLPQQHEQLSQFVMPPQQQQQQQQQQPQPGGDLSFSTLDAFLQRPSVSFDISPASEPADSLMTTVPDATPPAAFTHRPPPSFTPQSSSNTNSSPPNFGQLPMFPTTGAGAGAGSNTWPMAAASVGTASPPDPIAGEDASPTLNWASWDDMVREFGMDGDGAVAPGGADVTGMVGWY